ncbi:hypothetical protein [Paenibacillus aestuarii]|uniref:Uncharacterized protein n=1 Tax=Paenibacillus aestuarii TaxID=516965 RepID=A0ABW0K8K1_9BACL|nr:hypothetical protein [Paenibacillus aestuarii]
MSKKSLPVKKKKPSKGQKMDGDYNELDFLEESKDHEEPDKKSDDNEFPDWYQLIEMLLKR